MIDRTGRALHDRDRAQASSGFPQSRELCALCGLPLGGSATGNAAGPDGLRFCCHGCHQVFLLLSAASGVLPDNFPETELYRVCVESGVIPSPSAGPPQPAATDADAVLPLKLSFAVEGMWCPSCAWLIEEVLRRTTGIAAPKVSFVSDRLHLTYFPHIISPNEIAERVARLGYRLSSAGRSGVDQLKKNQVRLAVSAVLTCNIMMASVFFYGLVDVPEAVVRSFSYPVLVMASFVLFYAGLPILKRGFASLFYGAPSMDALISCGAFSAYIYSLARMAAGASDLYFDTASMLVVFVLFGRYIETRARQRIRRGTAELGDLGRGKVRGLRGAWKQADFVKPGERFIVDAGERTPLDSLVVSGHITVDESFLTGEAAYRVKGPGDRVPGGSAVRDGQATLEATATSHESLIGQIAAAVEKALERKDAHELLADRISRLFVPVILAVAAASSLAVWGWGASAGQAALRGMTVLLVACPCTLGIAIPLVKVASVGLALGFGALVRDPAALERMHGVDTVVFDKTGTLTEGAFSLQEILYEEGDKNALFSWLASVEVHSGHFVGREIVHEARRKGVAIMPAEGFETHEGLGVEGIVEGKKSISETAASWRSTGWLQRTASTKRLRPMR